MVCAKARFLAVPQTWRPSLLVWTRRSEVPTQQANHPSRPLQRGQSPNALSFAVCAHSRPGEKSTRDVGRSQIYERILSLWGVAGAESLRSGVGRHSNLGACPDERRAPAGGGITKFRKLACGLSRGPASLGAGLWISGNACVAITTP